MAILTQLGATDPVQPDRYGAINTVDPEATQETKALFANLRTLAPDRLLFGHQDALAYGVAWKEWNPCRSDVADVCGMHPAVFGWDVGKLGQRLHNIDTVDFLAMQEWMREVFRMGGINTISWHMDNLVTGGDSWDTGANVVRAILPGGNRHAAYVAKLDLFAEFVRELKVGFLFKRAIPIIFRPFHEHTGRWFWWGQPHCTPEEYKALWRFTVSYLRDVKGLHNLLYCYSPDIFRDREHYLECYPGDEWVDILGVDDYHDLSARGNSQDLIRRLRTVVELAEERGKVAALTETGQEKIPQPDWFTQRLLGPILADPVASRIAWALVWRNARPDHHYAPFPGHPAVADFLKFAAHPHTAFAGELPELYKL